MLQPFKILHYAYILILSYFISFPGKCAETAKQLGYKVFALQNGGQCFTSPVAQFTYQKYGQAAGCVNGVGGPNIYDVYSL